MSAVSPRFRFFAQRSNPRPLPSAFLSISIVKIWNPHSRAGLCLPYICPCDTIRDVSYGVPFPERFKADIFLLSSALYRLIPALPYFIACFFQESEEHGKVLRSFLQTVLDRCADLISHGMAHGVDCSLAAILIWFLIDDGIAIFQADNVAQSLQSKSRVEEVLEFPCSVKECGAKDNVVMDMCSVCMGGNRKRMLSFGKPHGGLISESVFFLWSDLSRLKRLPDLIGDDISLVFLSGHLLVFSFGEQKLQRGSFRLALIAADELSLLRLQRILLLASVDLGHFGSG